MQLRHAVIEVAMSAVAGLDTSPDVMRALCKLAMTVQRGLFVIPIWLPGTAWYAALQARPVYLSLLETIIRAR